MSNKDYISKEIEEIITKEIFGKYYSNFKIEGEDYILNKMTLDLFKIILRLIKFYRASYVLSDIQRLKLDIENLKSDNTLSENEIKYIENFFKILNIKSEILRDAALIEESFTYIISQFSNWFYNEQPNIYQKIIMLEEKEMIKENIKNF